MLASAQRLEQSFRQEAKGKDFATYDRRKEEES
jgi:hypothetical protein